MSPEGNQARVGASSDPVILEELLTLMAHPLTRREREDVLPLLVQGMSSQEIAQELCIQADSVKAHVSNVIKKLGVTDKGKAAYLGMLLGLVALDPDDTPAAITKLRERIARDAALHERRAEAARVRGMAQRARKLLEDQQ